MFTGATPSITPGQLAAVLLWIASPLVAALGFDVSRDLLEQIVTGASVIGAGWMVGDAHLRGQRARAILGSAATAAEIEAQRQLSTGQQASTGRYGEKLT